MPTWLWWIILYTVFVGLNTAGTSISLKFAVTVSFISIGVIALFAVMALVSGSVNWASLFDIVPDPGQTAFLPHGVLPILFALPFAMWLFLGIEELPLAAEESHNPVRDIPRAGLWARGTLIVTGVVVLVLNTAVLGANATGTAGEPLLDGFRTILGDDLAWVAGLLALFALFGLLASLQGIMFAYGRNLYSLSRAGYYPRFLSLTGKRQTPWVALIAGAVIGLAALIIVDISGGADGVGGAVVLNIAVRGAVLAYFMQMLSFIILRKKYPNANRPYRSPWGLFGAYSAAFISALIFLGFLLNESFRPVIVAIVIVYVIGLVIFGLYTRHRLILSPEEEYAVSGGLHGDPQQEGYGGAVEEELLAMDGVDEPEMR